ncbi:MAG: hypothetical protein IJC83_03220 [Oscillospiraceae bacterium]|nr:hypothetical protein [Oscillospiraceae bacterium]
MHKIKRNSSIYYNNSQRKRKRTATIIFIIVLAVLGFVGYCLFDPVAEFVDNLNKKITLGEEINIAENSSSTDVSSSSEEVTSSSSQEVEGEVSVPADTDDETSAEVSTEFDISAKLISEDMLKDEDKLSQFINKAIKEGYNSIAIEVKNTEGYLLYTSSLEKVNEAKAVSQGAVDLKPILEKLKQNNIKPIAVISAFKDSVASHKYRELAVSYVDNSSWLWYDNSPDKGGKPWLNANSELAREYVSNIVLECADMGFGAVVIHKVQFPEGVSLNLAQTGVANDGKNAVLSSFISTLNSELKQRGVELILADEYNKFITPHDFQLGGTLANIGAFTVAPFIDIDASMGSMQIGEKIYENPAENVKDIAGYILGVASNSYKSNTMLVITSDIKAEIIPLLKAKNSKGYIVLDNSIF